MLRARVVFTGSVLTGGTSAVHTVTTANNAQAKSDLTGSNLVYIVPLPTEPAASTREKVSMYTR